ncbi:porin [Paraburkholderia sp. HD33-4]|uniref:porin n=1 Tax=Paraburkholderia sp. HD33-4 TaxID=2883242 RepID=UPI001F2A32B8|nr:porin [Paraburkholderia sp. HD33-4]
MKLKEIALASAALLSAHAYAQSSVQVFGLIDAGVSYISNQGGSSNVRMDDGIAVPNLLGFSGNEDLGDGLSARFKLINQYTLGTGAIVSNQSNSASPSATGIFAREAWVSLDSTQWGSISLGRQQDFMVDTLFGNVGADAAMYTSGFYNFRNGPFSGLNLPDSPPDEAFDFDHMSGGTALSNSVKYSSTSLSGLHFGGMYAFGGTAGNFSENSAQSFGASYAVGGLALGAAYTNVKYAVLEGGSIRNWGAGARYSLGKALFTLLYTNTRNTENGAMVNAVEAGSLYQFTPATSFAANYMYMWGNAGVDHNHAHQLNGALQYALSKRTSVYAMVAYQITNEGADAVINGTFGPSSGHTQFIGRIGVDTRF